MKSVFLRSIVSMACGVVLLIFLPLSGMGAEPTGHAGPAPTPVFSLPMTAPDFSIKDISGNIVSLEDFKGKIVLLDFWATWCPPCNQTIPELIDLQKKYQDKGLVVLGVSIDDINQTDNAKMADFVNSKKINYTILRANEKIMTDYCGSTRPHIPLLFFIDGNGMIVDTHQGYEAGALEKKLKEVMP